MPPGSSGTRPSQPADKGRAGVLALHRRDVRRATWRSAASLIAGVGALPGPGGGAEAVRSTAPPRGEGRSCSPGFIDAHVHPETSLLSPPRFAEALVVHGITTTISEPHEITNVHGRGRHRLLPRGQAGPAPRPPHHAPHHGAGLSRSSRPPADSTPTTSPTSSAQEGVTGLGEAMDYMGLIFGNASGRLFDLSGHRRRRPRPGRQRAGAGGLPGRWSHHRPRDLGPRAAAGTPATGNVDPHP